MSKNIGFKQIDGAYVIIYEKGVFKQVDIFEMDSGIFAKTKGGFVRLHESGRTSHAVATWQHTNGVEWKVKRNSSHLEVVK